MKRKLSFLLIYGVLVLFGGLGTLVLLFGEKEPHASLTENRMLAGLPELSLQTIRNGRFMLGLEEYLSDGMFDRDTIVADINRLTACFSLQRPTEADVDEALFEQAQAFAQGANPDPIPDEPTLPIASETGHTAAQTEAASSNALAPTVDATPAEDDRPATQADIFAEKNLSDVPDCVLTCSTKDGAKHIIYQFPKANVQRMIRLLNAYRAVLPKDGHMFFTQPPFPGIANYLSSGEYTGWDSDLEDAINAYANEGVYMLSALKVLEQPLLEGEYLYFRTDHHWTPRAACYVANAFLQRLGIDPRPYSEYSFITYNNFIGSAASSLSGSHAYLRPDTIEVLIPKTPVQGYVIQWDNSQREAPLIYSDRNSYMAYLGGTLGPWRRFDTGVDCHRSCLVIGDSYDCAFVPFLTPYYETVHVTDVREAYYDYGNIQWSISEYIAQNGIDDVYFILSTASGVNTDSMIQYLFRFL